MINNLRRTELEELFFFSIFSVFSFFASLFFQFFFQLLRILARQYDDELAPRLCLLEVCYHLGQRSTNALLVQLRYFSATAHLSVFSEHLGKLLQGFHHPIRRLIENHGAHLIFQRLQIGLSSLFLRYESLEAESVTRQSRRHDGWDACRRPRKSLHGDASLSRLASQVETGVADAWGSRITDQCDGLACLESLNDACRRAMLIKLMMRH